jgi:predicted secreted protein
MRWLISTTVVVGLAAASCGGGDGADGARSPTAVPGVQATATASSPNEVQLTDADNGKTVRLARGGTMIVALESNPSTGFSWYVGETAGPELSLSGEPTFVPPGSTSPVVGAAGTQVFTFVTTDVGMPPAGTPAVVQVVLEYKRGFEPNTPPEKTFKFTVEID